MTHRQLVRAWARAGDLTLRQADQLERLYLAMLVNVVLRGDRLHVPRFGVWYRKSRVARNITNPATGEPMGLPAFETVGFRASRVLRRTPRAR